MWWLSAVQGKGWWQICYEGWCALWQQIYSVIQSLPIQKYSAHVNIEICSTISSCKYLYKYVYKGLDMASVQVVQSQADPLDTSLDIPLKEQDEIKKFVNLWFITASESYWSISGNDVHGREPSIQRLAVHEEKLQIVYFQENDVAEATRNPKNTTLLGWFKLNQVDADAQMLKYHEIPEHYIWNQSQHCWTKRKRGRCSYIQQIHLRVKGTICTYFSITFQVQKVLMTSRCPLMVHCLVH